MKKENNVEIDNKFGLLCKITYKEFCEMKLTNPNWGKPKSEWIS